MPNHLLRCRDCAALAGPAAWCCRSCGGLLRLEWSEAAPAARVEPDRPGVWRYRHLLPTVEPGAIVTLGEGATPIVWIDRWAAVHRLERVAVKLEGLNPTGS